VFVINSECEFFLSRTVKLFFAFKTFKLFDYFTSLNLLFTYKKIIKYLYSSKLSMELRSLTSNLTMLKSKIFLIKTSMKKIK